LNLDYQRPIAPRWTVRASRYALVGTGFWIAYLVRNFVRFGELSARKAAYAAILAAVAGIAAAIIEGRRGYALDWFMSLVLYCLCIGAVVVGLLIALSIR
jgi:hypothetical protein